MVLPGPMPARLMIAAPSGLSGKTIVATGVCACLRKRGLIVQAFKKGPDYIDPSWLSAASGRSCRNLDLYMMKKQVLVKSLIHATYDADIAVIEANMGFYDSIYEDGRDSSASLARILDIPVILVINCSRITRSVAAIIKGFQVFEAGDIIKGVILNNVSGIRHEKKLTHAVERHCSIPVVGALPRTDIFNIQQRHLGLIHFKEDLEGLDIMERISGVCERYMDMETLIEIAGYKKGEVIYSEKKGRKRVIRKKDIRIGVFYDRAFNFYYPENLEAIEKEGADLVFIDSIKDKKLPEIDGLYIGGGFPELYLHELGNNRSLMMEVAKAVEDYMPVYAECAGLMYLSDFISFNGDRVDMTGVIPSGVEVTKKPQGHGYMEVEVVLDNPYFKKGARIKGHEFHHSRLIKIRDLDFAFKIKRGSGIEGRWDGITYRNMFATYMHTHALGVRGWAKSLVDLSWIYKKSRSHKTIDHIEREVLGHV